MRMTFSGEKFIPQMEPWFGREEERAVSEYMASGGWITEFKKTEEFEQAIASYTGAKHCIVVNNGTVTLIMAAIACGIKPGDEVIVPNYTMIATPNAVSILGATPVFVDVCPETLCMDLDKLRSAINSKTRAVMCVTANGRSPKPGVKAFADLCEEFGVALIEDAAQSLGSYSIEGQHLGTIGLVGSLSFSSPKIISTGQGGALLTNDDEMALKLRKLKDFGRSGGGLDIHDSIGYNFKFTDVQACIGIEQMKKLPTRIGRKKVIYSLYKSLLDGVSQVSFFSQDLEHTVPWFIDVTVEDRENLSSFLKNRNIGSRVMYPPIHQQKAYQAAGSHPVSEMIGQKGLWLPSAAQLTDDQIHYICSMIREFYGH